MNVHFKPFISSETFNLLNRVGQNPVFERFAPWWSVLFGRNRVKLGFCYLFFVNSTQIFLNLRSTKISFSEILNGHDFCMHVV